MKVLQYSPSLSSPVAADHWSVPRPEDISSAQVMRLIPCRLKVLRLPFSLLPPASQLFSSLLDQISSIYVFSNTSHIKTTIVHLTLHPLQLPPHFSISFWRKTSWKSCQDLLSLSPIFYWKCSNQILSSLLYTYMLPESMFSPHLIGQISNIWYS